eukprot:jgi/Botrbrau1/10247/Bobra.0140s0004.1
MYRQLRGAISPCRIGVDLCSVRWPRVPCSKPNIGFSSAPRVGWAHYLLGYEHSASPGNAADRSDVQS